MLDHLFLNKIVS